MCRTVACSLVLLLTISACSASPGSTTPAVPPPAPTAAATVDHEPPVEPAPPPEPAQVEPPDPCAADPAAEAPVVQGEVGEGQRLIRLINEGEIELRVRLLDQQLKPVYPGTLRIPPGETGEYKVAEGVYNLRYRLQSSCEVRRGSAIRLTGRNSGYEKVIKTQVKQGVSGLSRKVDEAL